MIDVSVQILQALRSGSMTSSEMALRWAGASASVAKLVKKGYVISGKGHDDESNSRLYSITDLGRENCPSRNPHLKKVNEARPGATVAQVSRVHQATTAVVVGNQKTDFTEKLKAKEISVEDKKYTEGANALRILKFIEDNPNCRARDIAKATLIPTPIPFIKGRIKSGLVIADDSGGVKLFKLAENQNADSAYKGKPKPAATPVETPSVARIKDAHGQLADAVNNENQLEEADVSDFAHIDQEDSQKELDFTLLEKESSKFRVAYTSDGCLILMGLCASDIELDKEKVHLLIQFISERLR